MRQKTYQNLRSNLKPQAVPKITGREAARWSAGGRKLGYSTQGQLGGSPSDGKVRSFLFKNIPEGCTLDTLVNKFSRIGDVCDIFCPRKRDNEGKLFGFVRFEGKIDEECVLRDLNNIWIGSYKMRAFCPRFGRGSSSKNRVVTNNFPANLGVRKELIFLLKLSWAIRNRMKN